MNAANLTLRLLLELAALAGPALWIWGFDWPGWLRVALALLSMLTLMTIWGVFAVPEDPSRSGAAPVPVTGMLRLILELLVLLGGALAWNMAGHGKVALLFAALVLLHYLLSLTRIRWLLHR